MSSPSENVQVRGLYRANSAVYIPDSAQLCLGYQTPEGECTIRIGSFMVPGSEGPVPNGIWIKSEGSGVSPHDAESKFRNLVDDVAALAALLTNASTEEPTLEILYDVSAHRDRHEALFSSNTARYSAPPIRVRKCPSFIDAGMNALSTHEHTERLWRGVSSYATALRSWRKGHEPVALAFLYMATEALTYIARDSLFSQFGGADGLAAEWKIEKKVVDSEIRKRILFAGDDKLYKAAKDARNQMFHGYGTMGSIVKIAEQRVEGLAATVRGYIIEHLFPSGDYRTLLLSAAYSTPLSSLPARAYARGYLSNDSTGSGRPTYAPSVHFSLEPTHLEPISDVEWESQWNISGLLGRLAPGTTFDVTEIGVDNNSIETQAKERN